MATSAYYKDKYGRNFTPGQGLPTVSTELDSVRAYQFEIHFFGLPEDITNQNTVQSSRIANAKISYTGAGDVADSAKKGWLSKLIDAVQPL